jgi:hypothetical protein
MEKREQQEIKIQSDAYMEVYNTRPELRGRLFAINNNSENNIKGALNKAMGVYAGVSDMCFILDSGYCAWIEWKTSTGVQSKGQKEWQFMIENLGHKYYIVRSRDDLFSLIEKLLKK